MSQSYQLYGSFQSVSNLLKLVEHDFGLTDDLTLKYLGDMSVPAQPLAPAPPLATKPVQAPAPSAKPSGPKTKKVHIPGVSCVGTNRHGCLCCNPRSKSHGNDYCRHHQSQLSEPVAPKVVPDDSDAVSTATDLSVHTAVVVCEPPTQAPAAPPPCHGVFVDVFVDTLAHGHLLTKTTLPLSGYSGPAVSLTALTPALRSLFDTEAIALGLFTCESEGYLHPTGYMPEEIAETSPIPAPVVPETAETDEPSTYTPVFATTECSSAASTSTTAECEDDACSDIELTASAFQSIADSCGLEDEVDLNVEQGLDYFDFGIYISGFDDLAENLKLLRERLSDRGFQCEELEDDDEKYLVVCRPTI